VTPDEAIAQARSGRLSSIYLVAGEERLLRDRVVEELRKAALGRGMPDFNEDKFTAGEVGVETVIAAARTVPLMANRRFVLVRAAERWDASEAASPSDAVADYASTPSDSTCLVIVASKVDLRRKLAQLARRQGFLVPCDPIESRALPGWIVSRFNAKGHSIDRGVAELLAALTGPDLSSVDDAIERLSLYAGAGQPIDERLVGVCVARVRTADTWALVDAVGARDLARALRTLADAYDPRERGLPLLGALAWSMRQLARAQAAVVAGRSPDEAVRQAGVFQPGRARELAAKLRSVTPKEVERWMLVLAETDLALKSSRRPADAILEEMLTRLCRPQPRTPPARARPI
jgi:DNA polymerase III subunit delta